MSSEITASELCKLTGKTKSHVSHLVKRGILPAGRREGKFVYYPRVESILILHGHEANKYWKPRKSKGRSCVVLGEPSTIEVSDYDNVARPDWSKLL